MANPVVPNNDAAAFLGLNENSRYLSTGFTSMS
jgi:hypothetical protein